MCFRSFELVSLPSSLAATIAILSSKSFFPLAPLLWCEKRATVALMGHNKGRDNARRRAKRRKKNERLASAKQPAARQRKNADK